MTEFQHPTSVGVHIRIIAGPTSDSFEGMLENIKTVGVDSLKRMLPTANITIEKNKIGTHNVVKIHTSAEEIMEQEMWQFIATGIKYNIVFGANNKTQFEANHNILENLLGSFVVQEKPGKGITENDIKISMTANRKRLAELSEKINQLDVAVNNDDSLIDNWNK